jgi:hypothetical protein
MNIRIYGSKTKNHARPVPPPRHNILSTHVQNTIYNNFNTKIMNTLDTLQLYEPTQYNPSFPKF